MGVEKDEATEVQEEAQYIVVAPGKGAWNTMWALVCVYFLHEDPCLSVTAAERAGWCKRL